MACALQRKHDERYENKRKEASGVSSLVERCKTLEREIAEVEEIVEARETLLWLTGASPSMQKSAIEEDSDHLVTLQPNKEDDDGAGVPPIDEGIAAAKIWEPGENSDRKDER